MKPMLGVSALRLTAALAAFLSACASEEAWIYVLGETDVTSEPLVHYSGPFERENALVGTLSAGQCVRCSAVMRGSSRKATGRFCKVTLPNGVAGYVMVLRDGTFTTEYGDVSVHRKSAVLLGRTQADVCSQGSDRDGAADRRSVGEAE